MLSKIMITATILAFWTTAAAAQSGAGGCPPPKTPDPPQFPSWLSVTLGVAPEFTENRPFDDVDEDSDKTTLTLSAVAKHCLTNRFGVKLSGGPSITLDDDDDSKGGSKLSTSVELRWFSGIGPIVPVAAVGTAAYFGDIFGNHRGNDQFFEAGTSLGDQGWTFWSISDRRKLNITGRAVWRWVDSDTELGGDYQGPSIDGKLEMPLWPKRIALNVKGTYSASKYRRLDLVAGKRRDDENLAVFAGVDFSGLLKPEVRILKEASFGVTWAKTWSNIDEDTDKLNLQPVLKLGLPF